LSKQRKKILVQGNTIKGLSRVIERLQSEIETMVEEDNNYTKVDSRQFAIMFTDSQELKHIDKIMKKYGDHFYHQVAREAEDKYSLHRGEPLVERPGVRKMLKRGFRL